MTATVRQPTTDNRPPTIDHRPGGCDAISLLGCGECNGTGPYMLGALIWGGGIGALVDVSILTPRDVYRVGQRRFEVQPVASRSSAGIRVAVAW